MFVFIYAIILIQQRSNFHIKWNIPSARCMIMWRKILISRAIKELRLLILSIVKVEHKLSGLVSVHQETPVIRVNGDIIKHELYISYILARDYLMWSSTSYELRMNRVHADTIHIIDTMLSHEWILCKAWWRFVNTTLIDMSEIS